MRISFIDINDLNINDHRNLLWYQKAQTVNGLSPCWWTMAIGHLNNDGNSHSKHLFLIIHTWKCLQLYLWNRGNSPYPNTINPQNWKMHPLSQRHSSHTSCHWLLFLPSKIPGSKLRDWVFLKSVGRALLLKERYQTIRTIWFQSLRLIPFVTLKLHILF